MTAAPPKRASKFDAPFYQPQTRRSEAPEHNSSAGQDAPQAAPHAAPEPIYLPLVLRLAETRRTQDLARNDRWIAGGVMAAWALVIVAVAIGAGNGTRGIDVLSGMLPGRPVAFLFLAATAVWTVLLGFRLFWQSTVQEDDGLELNERGVVFRHREHTRYEIPWSQIGRIGKPFMSPVDAFELREPLMISTSNGKTTATSFIPFGHFEENWRYGKIGRVIRVCAPALWSPAFAIDHAENAGEPSGYGLRLPHTAWVHDVIDPNASSKLHTIIAHCVAILISIGLVFLGLWLWGNGVVVFMIWTIPAIYAFIGFANVFGTLRGEGDFGVRFEARGLTYLGKFEDEVFVPWNGTKCITRDTLLSVETQRLEFVEPFKVRARMGPGIAISSFALNAIDPFWETGTIAEILRTYAPHLFGIRPAAVAEREGDEYIRSAS